MMRPAVVRLVGNSSLGSNTPRSLLRAVRTYALRSNFIVTTEVGRNERSDALRGIAGWSVAHIEDPATSGEDEVAIQHRLFGWRRVSVDSDVLSRQPIARRGGQRARSLDALYENRRTKQRVMICAFHLPNTEDGQLAIWLDCIDRLMTKADRWRNDSDIDAVILVGDWNANFRRPSMRSQLRQAFLGAQWTWQGDRMPGVNVGTHRRNLIDYAAVYGGTITRAELLADDGSSDHRPWWMRCVVGAR